MFGSIRDKFQSLQENISTTLKGFSSGETQRQHGPDDSCNLNFNAGTDILESFQTAWSELHEASQENALKAQAVDELISSIHQAVDKQQRDMVNMTTALLGLPDVLTSVNDLCNKTVALKELFDTVEKSLIQLEDVMEEREFQSRQLEHRFQLVLNQEKRLAMLETLKSNLERNYQEKLRKHEEEKVQECKEATETNLDVQTGLNKGKSHDSSNVLSTQLEDIVLDDNDDSNALDEFLNESKEDELKTVPESWTT